MDKYVGIDLGTTNSVICSYDGQRVQVWKSPEQNDVTPSVICEDKRGHRYYGRRAYDMAPANEKNTAMLFKRYMGTNKVFTFEASGTTMTPEACSAEILRKLFGYLPEDVRTDPDLGIVITVPAAFNQMKKDATLAAARLAEIGHVALMQEPVAAVMSVMQHDDAERVFLIYDLGGGTFDVSVAESSAGHVYLLTQGGREMCGGRDWDRLIYRNIVEPWLNKRFNLPKDNTDPTVIKLKRIALLAAEQAKIELSSCFSAVIHMDEMSMNVRDMDGRDIYLDVPITRNDLDGLIESLIDDTVSVAQETLQKAGLQPDAVSQIVFVGGPTCYKPLRDKVSAALGISGNVQVNPMTAVAEGAAIYAESIDWSSRHHEHKAARAEVVTPGRVKINYEKRVAADTGRLAFISDQEAFFVEIFCEDTGWSSGRVSVGNRSIMEVPLASMGENRFRVEFFDRFGNAFFSECSQLVITRTLATVSAIPASYSIAVKALDRIGGKAVPVYLVRENDPLPKSGSVTFRAGQSLAAGSSDALVFTLWEGSVRDPIEDNRYIGTYRIPGTSFFSGVIPAGAEIICEYSIDESGTLHLGVSIPAVGVNLAEKNFYSRVDGQTDIHDAPRIISEAKDILERTQEIKLGVNAPEVERIRLIAMNAMDSAEHDSDPESLQEAENALLECRRKVAALKQAHLKQIRQLDLEEVVRQFERLQDKAQSRDIVSFKNLEESARRAISHDSAEFDNILDEMRGCIGTIVWRQDDFVKFHFLSLTARPDRFADRALFDRLRAEGMTALENGRMDRLRITVSQLHDLMIQKPDSESMFDDVNIIRN